MQIKLLLVMLFSLAVLFAMTGCSTGPASTMTSTTTSITGANRDPWPGVPVYRDSKSPIQVSLNSAFSIVLPPAPLFGWGWQNTDLSAFNLLETKTVLGPANEPDPYGPDAFLFKALKAGSYQIILYVPSKPPQQTEKFDIVVNP
jgi:hypothetical protein